MSKQGTLTFKQKDGRSHFLYKFKISNYHAAKILEYVAQIPHEVEPWRDSKGRFTKASDLVEHSPQPSEHSASQKASTK